MVSIILSCVPLLFVGVSLKAPRRRPRPLALPKKVFTLGRKKFWRSWLFLIFLRENSSFFCLIIYYCLDCRCFNNMELLLLVWAWMLLSKLTTRVPSPGYQQEFQAPAKNKSSKLLQFLQSINFECWKDCKKVRMLLQRGFKPFVLAQQKFKTSTDFLGCCRLLPLLACTPMFSRSVMFSENFWIAKLHKWTWILVQV